MNKNQKYFLKYQAQTTLFSSSFEVSHAKGSYIFGANNKKYLDFVAGVSVNTLGHCNSKINKKVKKQLDQHAHVMVYGEFISDSSLQLCKKLAAILPKNLESTYLVNSGAEAIEGALKLAKRHTGREKIIAFKNSYHGNTHGALSVSGNEDQKRAFRPLLPMVEFISFNNLPDLDKIDENVAAVILEPIQGAAGFILPDRGFLKALKKKCREKGAVLIFDEIQPGFGRTGKLFFFMHENVSPDILVIGKGMANGLPIGAFISSNKIMKKLADNPILGHITTFGGNPVIASAALATLEELYAGKYMDKVQKKSEFIRVKLNHRSVKKIYGIGLMLALELKDDLAANKLIEDCFNDGLILFKLLYRGNFVRITPPLTISLKELEKGCEIILKNLN